MTTTKPRAIHQLLHTLSYGDAISGEVLALQRVLRESGYESEIYAINVHPKHKGNAHKYEMLSTDVDAEVIFHFSLGSPLNEFYRSLQRARRTLIFHNLTPSHWFKGVNPRVARDIEHGAVELPEMCAISDRVIADSAYNAKQLKDLGFHAEVLPLPLDNVKWSVPTNPGIAALVQNEPGIHVMHVGRLAPNKCVEDIIKSFYFLHHKIDRKSRLWLAGIDIDTELYSFSLKRLVEELDLVEAVNFVGCMADSEIKALYENCSAYVCMSEHEGFCVPLIEAMNFGCPVLAYDSTAVPDTLGNGGVLVKEKRHPEIAELLYEMHYNATFRSQLQEAGFSRAKDFSYEAFARNVHELLLTDATAPVLQKAV